MREKRIRQVKMYSRYRSTDKRWLGQSKEVPWLNISRLWLQQAGFKIGDQLRINVENNKLIITNRRCHGDQSH